MEKINKKAFDFFSKPSTYLRNNYTIEIRKKYLNACLVKSNNFTMLDLGCGDGSLSIPFLNKLNRLVCVDFSDEMLSLVHQRTPKQFEHKVDLVHKSITDFNSAEKFDVIFCIGVLAHVASIEETIELIKKHCKPGTKLYIQYSNANAPEQRLKMVLKKRLDRINEIKDNDMKSLFKKKGFKVQGEFKYFDGSLGFNAISYSLGKSVQNFVSRFKFLTAEHIVSLEFDEKNSVK